MEFIIEFVKDVMSNFDFAYMFTVNIVTYLVIKFIDSVNGKHNVPTWLKRTTAVFIGIILGISAVYLGSNNIVILYSFFVSLVSWDFAFKPILNILGDKFNYKSNSKN